MMLGLAEVYAGASIERGGDTYHASRNGERALRFRPHYLCARGHFLDHVLESTNSETQAVASARSLVGGAGFVTARAHLFEIRARRIEAKNNPAVEDATCWTL
jgi:hypothetical protein